MGNSKFELKVYFLAGTIFGFALLAPTQSVAIGGQNNADQQQQCPVDNWDDCQEDADCGEGSVCVDGLCEYAPLGCYLDSECTSDEVCIDGMCELASEYQCSIDRDCYRGEQCIDGYCSWVGDLFCESDSDCEAGDTCQTGRCVDDSPEQCVWMWEPVCGVDATTYANACFARQAEVEIAHEGVCAEPQCRSNEECSSQKCVDGICVDGCPDIYVPVCGEDGITYDSQCFADLSGVAVAFEGECDPSPGTCEEVTCPQNEHCELIEVECPSEPCYPLPVCTPDNG